MHPFLYLVYDLTLVIIIIINLSITQHRPRQYLDGLSEDFSRKENYDAGNCSHKLGKPQSPQTPLVIYHFQQTADCREISKEEN